MKRASDSNRQPHAVIATPLGQGPAPIPAGGKNRAGTRLFAPKGTASQTAQPRQVRDRASTDPCAPDVAQVLAAALALGVNASHFERYAARRWGVGWKRNAVGRLQALDEIDRYRNDAVGFIDKIDVALGGGLATERRARS